MSKTDNERYFAAGLAGTIFALYAFSMFTYFSNGENIRVAEASGTTAPASITADQYASSASREQLTAIMSQAQSPSIFSPLEEGERAIPGVRCRITEMNLDASYNFQGLPEDCAGILSGE